MKTCKVCLVEKPLSGFSTNGPRGYHPVCKACRALEYKEKRASNPEAFRAAERARYAADPTKRNEAARVYHAKNAEKRSETEKARYLREPERIKARCKAYRDENKPKVREWNGTRRARLKLAMPKWADRRAIANIYKEASKAWEETGVPHHVDHIIPLCGALVSGLHVESNLQVLPSTENLKKGRSFAHG